MIKTILIDDENKCLTTMRAILERYCPQVVIAATASNGVEGLKAIEKIQPDLIFLDIEMPIMSGLKMMEEIKEPNFQVVFTTAYDQYAINAFKFSALDYLLKPIDEQEVIAVIKKMEDKKNSTHDDSRLKILSEMMKNVELPTRHRKIALPSGEGFYIKSLNDIAYMEADGNYTKVFFSDKKMLLVSKQMGDFDEMLNAQFFFRIHKGFLINMDFVSEYMKADGGMVRLLTGAELPLARRRRDEFLALLELAYSRNH